MKHLFVAGAVLLLLSACHVPPGHNPAHCPPGHVKNGKCFYGYPKHSYGNKY